MSNIHSNLTPLAVEIRNAERRALFVFSSTNLRRHGIIQLSGMMEDDMCYNDKDEREVMTATAQHFADLVEFDTLKAIYENGMLSFTFEELYYNLLQATPELDNFAQVWFIRNDLTGDMIKFDPQW